MSLFTLQNRSAILNAIQICCIEFDEKDIHFQYLCVSAMIGVILKGILQTVSNKATSKHLVDKKGRVILLFDFGWITQVNTLFERTYFKQKRIYLFILSLEVCTPSIVLLGIQKVDI